MGGIGGGVLTVTPNVFQPSLRRSNLKNWIALKPWDSDILYF